MTVYWTRCLCAKYYCAGVVASNCHKLLALQMYDKGAYCLDVGKDLIDGFVIVVYNTIIHLAM